MAGIIPSLPFTFSPKGSGGGFPKMAGGQPGKSSPRTSVFRAEDHTQKPREKPLTSIAHRGEEAQSAVGSRERQEAATSVYGRSRAGLKDFEEEGASDDQRYAYGQRMLLLKKRKEVKAEIQKTERALDGASGKSRTFMKETVKKYAWKKPIAKEYTEKTRFEMKKKVDQAAEARGFSEGEVQKMKKLVEEL